MDAHQPNLFPLKLLVISLGVLLFGAIVFMLIVIATKANTAADKAPVTACADATVDLENMGAVASIAPVNSTTLLITLNRTDGKNKALTVNRCTGEILQTVTVVPQ